jgi:phage terminase large subunit-like protein
MPWQQHVLDVALEVDPATGMLAYRDVRITVPRQSGKSTLILPWVVWRAFAAPSLGGPQRMVYAAQTRADARKKWEHDYVVALRGSRAMAGRFEVRLANGDERVSFAGGSSFGITSTTEKAAHGQTLDFPIQDEAFALVDDRMDQAFRPAMITRQQAQQAILSTAGHAGSVYLRRKVDEGRAAAEADLDHGVAYFEWSADEDSDPEDPATWWSCMPALGHTVTEDAVRGELASLARPEFRRAFLNQWTDQVIESVIPLAWWRARHHPGATIAGSPVAAIDVSPMATRAAIAVAGASTAVDDAVHLELAAVGDGIDWAPAKAAEIKARHGARAVALDPAGPAGQLVQPLRELGIEPLLLNGRQMAQACGGLYSAARDNQITHLGDPIVEEAIRVAATRTLGDAWAWKRRTSTGDITPLVSFTIARWAHAEAEEVAVPLVAWL